MTSFFVGHSVDSIISYPTLMQGWQEIGFLRGSEFLGNGQVDQIIIAKMGVVALLVGAYALSKDMQFKGIKVGYAVEKAIQTGTFAVWAVQAWNLLNVAASLIEANAR